MIHTGDALTVLRTLPSGSVHCCVTSPPYWGLRDYGTAKWKGGERGCDHKRPTNTATYERKTLTGGTATIDAASIFKGDCGKCGAVRVDAQMGLEATPELYVSRMVEVFHEVRRILRNDGTLWLNLGDSYASSGPRANHNGTGMTGLKRNVKDEKTRLRCCAENKLYRGTLGSAESGLKPKDLIGIPWRVAFALQADGWYLRSDIIWHKPNPMRIRQAHPTTPGGGGMNMWTYSQQSGEMRHNGTSVATGYSGFGIGRNNPGLERVHETGPIPRGSYKIGPERTMSTLGPMAMPLTPDPANEMYGRAGFFIHGNDSAHPLGASHGCIVLGPQPRRQIAGSGDVDLEVTE